MTMLIYGKLARDWYRLLDPLDDHEDEAAVYERMLLESIVGPAKTLLELGAGAGNNAYYLKRRFACTLTDRSSDMLALSRQVNPECRHVIGDMRELRLETEFDVVFVHDAVMYITTRRDLQAVADTAFAHVRPGGVALFAPDCVTETFCERSDLHGDADGDRSLRCIEWSWDPDPRDETVTVDYVFALREGTQMTVHHDQHVEGLFARGVWLQVLEVAGFVPHVKEWREGDRTLDVFVAKRPG
ncbi:MAG: trans-aconitate 2-methyltransferase [Vicinamibacterales bacterium]